MIPLLIILAILLFLNCLPLGAHVIFDENGLVLKAVLGLIQIKLLPKKVKVPKHPPVEGTAEPDKKAMAKAAKEQKKAAEQTEKKEEKRLKKEEKKLRKKEKPKKPIGALLEEFLPLIRLGLKAIGELPKLPVIRKLKLRITYGGEDAAKAAMNYGVAWGAIGAGTSMLGRVFRIRKQDIRAELDYGCKKTRVSADACFTLTLGRIMVYLLHYGARALGIMMKQKKEKALTEKALLEKGGAAE